MSDIGMAENLTRDASGNDCTFPMHPRPGVRCRFMNEGLVGV